MKKMLIGQESWTKIKRIIAALLFLLIVAKMYASITYLFRLSDVERTHVIGIREEEQPIDMVYIGGSATYVYWQPLNAWNDYGFTSYNLATNTIQAEAIKYYIKQALRYQEPELFVIGVRAFQYYGGENAGEGVIRRSSDSLELGIDRIRLINEYLEHYDLGQDMKVPLYFDIMKYHTNYDALKDSGNWAMIDNRHSSPNKGFEWIYAYQYLDAPEDFITEETAELPVECLDTLYDLLNFCQEEDLNVLFVVCPYYINQTDYSKYNTMEEIITSYGYSFLNANDYYEEMEINFAEDFYNGNHVNCYGAEKWTKYLGGYIVENYDMSDHRGDKSYSSWEEAFTRFCKEQTDVKLAVDQLRQSAEEGRELASLMAETVNFPEWSTLVSDSRFTVLAVGDGKMGMPECGADRKAFNAIGLDVPGDGKPYIRWVSAAGDGIIYTNLNKAETSFSVTIGVRGVPSTIKNSNNELSIVVDGEEYSRQDEGINVVVFNNDYEYVVDSVTLKYDENGRIELIR